MKIVVYYNNVVNGTVQKSEVQCAYYKTIATNGAGLVCDAYPAVNATNPTFTFANVQSVHKHD